jgi:hypothetical protein
MKIKNVSTQEMGDVEWEVSELPLVENHCSRT